MKRKMRAFLLVLISFLLLSGFTTQDDEEWDIIDYSDYKKEYVGIDVGVCSSNSTKTYMFVSSITSKTSRQYKYIQEYMKIDETTGLVVDEEGFIGVALGSYYGEIGSKYYFTLDTDIVLPVVKIDSKSDSHTVNGCAHSGDGSVIEFVIDREIASDYFGVANNGLINSGNFNNDERFKGKIVMVEEVTDEKSPEAQNQINMIDSNTAVVTVIEGGIIK